MNISVNSSTQSSTNGPNSLVGILTGPNNGLTPLVGALNLVAISLGLLGNTLAFIIFRFHKSFKRMPSMVFLSFVAVTDTIALFEWNLNHFTIIYSVNLMTTLLECRLVNFIQYASLQSSALILSLMCVDRYITVVALPGSFLQKLPFRTNRTAFIWSSGVIIFAIILNSHLLFLLGNFYMI